MKNLLTMGIVAGIFMLVLNLRAQEQEFVTKKGEWFEMQYSPNLEKGKEFTFRIKLTGVKPELKLVCGFHWSKGKEYGGLLKIFAQQKDVENDKWYEFKPVIDEIPAEATSVRIAVHTSPTGNWQDRVNKGESAKIPIAK